MKLSLTSDRDLKLFYSLVAPVKGEPQREWTLAYAGEEVLNNLRKKYEANPSVISIMGDLPIKNLLESIELSKYVDVQEVKEEQKVKEMTKESFINGMTLVADRFIESANDRKSIKRILGKIKCD